MIDIKWWIDDNELDQTLFNEYIKHFPKIELNTLDSISSYRKFNNFGLFNENECLGGCYFWHFEDINIIVIEFIFINENHRGLGYSNIILDLITSKYKSPIVIEVNDGSDAESFWSHHGFKRQNYKYTQPPIIDGNDSFDGLSIWSNKSDLDLDNILNNYYFKFAFA